MRRESGLKGQRCQETEIILAKNDETKKCPVEELPRKRDEQRKKVQGKEMFIPGDYIYIYIYFFIYIYRGKLAAVEHETCTFWRPA